MLTKKNSKKMHTNLNKCQMEMRKRNLISACNLRVKSAPAGRVAISSRQNSDHVVTT